MSIRQIVAMSEIKGGKNKISPKDPMPSKPFHLEVFHALMASHTRRILINKDSMWVKWILSYRLLDGLVIVAPYLPSMISGTLSWLLTPVKSAKLVSPLMLRSTTMCVRVGGRALTSGPTLMSLAFSGHTPIVSPTTPGEPVWRNRVGNPSPFSGWEVWRSIGLEEPDVDWYHHLVFLEHPSSCFHIMGSFERSSKKA
ncbi:hypothetical protein LXL04_028398 [Taraxacum kok-saghyz]